VVAGARLLAAVGARRHAQARGAALLAEEHAWLLVRQASNGTSGDASGDYDHVRSGFRHLLHHMATLTWNAGPERRLRALVDLTGSGSTLFDAHGLFFYQLFLFTVKININFVWVVGSVIGCGCGQNLRVPMEGRWIDPEVKGGETVGLLDLYAI
ncbi:hypothetical protein BHE74_00053933, partial [Ensete ventricosum]